MHRVAIDEEEDRKKRGKSNKETRKHNNIGSEIKKQERFETGSEGNLAKRY